MKTNPHINQSIDKSKSHTIPKEITNLENLFDLKERFKGSKKKIGSSYPMHETINIRTLDNPKNLKLEKTISK
jgi:hypothetical protein